jgi:hypothetical protein
LEMRTVAGPSSVVQWVLSGGPYTVSSQVWCLWADHPRAFDAPTANCQVHRFYGIPERWLG